MEIMETSSCAGISVSPELAVREAAISAVLLKHFDAFGLPLILFLCREAVEVITKESLYEVCFIHIFQWNNR